MGNSNTKKSPQLSQEQADIKYLGSKYPFGDDELIKLYRGFHRFIAEREGQQLDNEEQNERRISFLSFWAVESVVVNEFSTAIPVCKVLETNASTEKHEPPPSPLESQEQQIQLQPTAPPPPDANNEKPLLIQSSSHQLISTSLLDEMKQERHLLMQLIEAKILPPGFSDLLEQRSVFKSPSYGRMQNIEQFFEGMANFGRRGGRQALSVLFDCYAVEKPVPSPLTPQGAPYLDCDCAYTADNNVEKTMMVDSNLVLTLAYRLSLAAAFLDAVRTGDDVQQWIPQATHDPTAVQGLCRSMVDFVKRKRLKESPYGDVRPDPDLERGFVEKLDLQEFAEYNLPVLSSALSYFMFQVFFPEKPYPPSRTAFRFPKLVDESFFFDKVTSPLLFSLASLSMSLGSGSWHRLYTSSQDGLSFNRLLNALLGYAGPTLIVIREVKNGGMFGAFTASPWKETKDFYGSSDCFLYQLIPTTAVYRPTGNGANFMYCNSEARSRGYDGQAHGIGFGGDVFKPRLFITETFENCNALSRDLTFEHGSLLSQTGMDGKTPQSSYFDVDSLEVWGVGGDEVVAEALGARLRQREIMEATLRKARKVDKAAFLDDFRSGIIESKAFAYREQIRGRADAAVDDRNAMNA